MAAARNTTDPACEILNVSACGPVGLSAWQALGQLSIGSDVDLPAALRRSRVDVPKHIVEVQTHWKESARARDPRSHTQPHVRVT